MGTYYIDYVGGSDSNNGTSKLTPWKKCPGMKGFGGSYTHAAGDTFIFKGGVSWLVDCFQMKVQSKSGTSDSVRDTYTADETWYSGGSFTRPIFDFQNTTVGSGWTLAAGVLFVSCNYVTIRNIEFARHRAPWASATVSIWGSFTLVFDTCNNFLVENCVGRDWDQAAPIPSGGGGGGFVMKVNTGGGHVVRNCNIHQSGSATRNGTACWNIPTVEDCEIHDIGGSGIMSSNVVRNNHIYNLFNADDPLAHGNALLCPGNLICYNNIIHDTAGIQQVVFFNPAAYGPGIATVYNNVVYDVAQPCIAVDSNGVNDPNAKTQIYNNTLIGPGGTGTCIRLGARGAGPTGYFDYRNNHLISTNPLSLENTILHLTASHNLSSSVATATTQGYVSAYLYAPTSSAGYTINVGTNLSSMGVSDDIRGISRPYGGYFDVGAYEWDGTTQPEPPTGSPEPPAPTETGSYGTASFVNTSFSVDETTPSVTLVLQRSNGDSGSVSVSYHTSNGTAFSGVNYTSTSGTASWGHHTSSNQTFEIPILNSNFSGSKTFYVNLSNPIGGVYIGPQGTSSITVNGNYIQGLIFEAESAQLTSPMNLDSTSSMTWIYSDWQTIVPSPVGMASYTFQITETGYYLVTLYAKTPSGANNSIYLNIDDPNFTEPEMVWDMPVSTEWTSMTSSWRGNGTFEHSQYSPKTWFLTEGQHILYVGSREAGALIDSITMSFTQGRTFPPVNVIVRKVGTGIPFSIRPGGSGIQAQIYSR